MKIEDYIPEVNNHRIQKFEIYTRKDKMSCNMENYLNKNNLKYGLAMVDRFYKFAFDYISYLQSKFQPKITINGHDAEFFVGYVKFGCAKFDNEIFRKSVLHEIVVDF